MKQCLVVDSSSIVRKVVRTIVEGLGYEVVDAESGEQALECCTARMPEVLLLDWYLPTMNAIEFLAALRAMTTGKRPFIVYCTTVNDPADITRAFNAGADEYLLKPYDKAAIASLFGEIGAAA
jgi:two-component system chemotaxis response regulator CheY